MVATVGSIAVDLSANTAKFIAGFKNSATTVERESKRMSNAISGFSKKASGIGSAFIGGIVAGGTLAAIASLTGAIGKARQSLSDFEEIGNRAKATGLSTDTFQAISHGASLADVEQESLNKSLEIFAKNAGLAKEGIGTLYSGLIKLNPQLLQSVLHATSQEERLKLVADAMAGMTDATDKAALATAVFGKGGAEMVRVLDKGSASIEKMKRDAQDLGIVIPEELIARSGELDDKLTTLAKVIDVNISEALVKAAPLLVALAEGLVKVAQGTNAASEAIGTVKDIIKDTPNRMDQAEIIRTAARQKAAVAELNDAWNEYFKIQEDIAAGDQFAIFKTDDALAKIAELQGKVNALDKHAKDIKVTMDTSQARAAIDQLRSSDLAALWADAGGKPTGRHLPTVHHGVDTVGGNAVDPETGEKIEAAIKKETEATYITGRYNRDAIGKLDANTGEHFNGLGSALDSGFGRLIDATNLLPGKYSLAMVNAMQNNRSSFSGGNTDSWAGRQYTIGGGGGGDASNPLGLAGVAGYYSSMNTGDPASISGGGDTSPINVSVTVRPILEGQRLSGQSSAEIKQAASAGANTALRAFYGR